MEFKETVQAFKWTADINQKEDPEWICKAIADNGVKICGVMGNSLVMMIFNKSENKGSVLFKMAYAGDYIIKHKDGIITSCSEKMFKKLYEPIKR